MKITELTINDVAFARYCPAGETVTNFLHKLLNDLTNAEHSERYVRFPGTAIVIDKAEVTSLTVTVER